jgi:hypothetical protein
VLHLCVGLGPSGTVLHDLSRGWLAEGLRLSKVMFASCYCWDIYSFTPSVFLCLLSHPVPRKATPATSFKETQQLRGGAAEEGAFGDSDRALRWPHFAAELLAAH